jgi:hypothetical protein
MAIVIYTHAKYLLATKQLDLATAPLKVMLVTPDYVADFAQKFIDDGTSLSASIFECSGTGYAGTFGGTGRKLLTNVSVIEDNDLNRVRLFADNTIWNPINVGLAGGFIIVTEVTQDTDSPLLAYSNEGFPLPTDGGELQLRWNINGIFAF